MKSRPAPLPAPAAGMPRRSFFRAAGGAALVAALPVASMALTGSTARADALTRRLRTGVTGHHPWINGESYPATGIADQMRLAKDLGMSDYRVDWFIPERDEKGWDWSWNDAVVATAETLGLDLLCVLTPVGGNDRAYADYAQRTAKLVRRYRGRIRSYQLHNELDNLAIHPHHQGSVTRDFDAQKVQYLAGMLTGLSHGVTMGDPAARRVMTVSWKHTGFLEAMHGIGLEYDVNAINWYAHADQNALTGDEALLETLEVLQRFPQPETMITELNFLGGASGQDTMRLLAQSARIRDALDALADRAPSKLSTVFAYELIDQPGAHASESVYGLHTFDRLARRTGAEKPVAAVFRQFAAKVR